MTASFLPHAHALSRLARLALVGLLLVVPASAQEEDPPTVEALEALVEQVTGVEGEGAEAIAAVYRQAIEALQAAADARTRAETLAADAAEAPALIEALQTELAQPLETPPDPDVDDVSLEVLEGRYQQAEAELAAARASVAELELLREFRTNRKAELPEEITARQNLIASTVEALSVLEPGEANQPRRLLLRAQLDEHRAALAALETERDTYEARRDLLPLRRDRAARAVTVAERKAEALKAKVDELRTREGEAAAQEAGELVEDITARFPGLLQVAAKNRSLAELRSGEDGYPRQISAAQEELASDRAVLEESSRRFRSARRKIAAGGLTEGMAGTLRRDYEWLTTVAANRPTSNERRQRLSDAQLEMIALEEEREELGDLVSATEELLARLGNATAEPELRRTARDLLAKQRDALDAALEDLSTLTAVYYEQRDVSAQLEAAVGEYRDYIEKRILWVRSTALDPTDSLLRVPEDASAIALHLGTEFADFGFFDVLTRRTGGFVLFVVVLVGLLFGRPLLRRQREEMNARVRPYKTDAYLHTIRALVHTFLLALPLPLIAWYAGWTLAGTEDEELRALGAALREIAVVWLVIRTLAELVTEGGVGPAHFKWSGGTCSAVARELRWFEPIAVGLGVVVLFLQGQSVADWSDSVGRLSFVFVMLGLAVVFHRLLREESRLWAVHPKTGKGLLGRTHGVWSVVATGLPLGLAAIASLGYYYTALQFELRLRYSIALALSLVLANALLFRWLYMARRRLAVSQALEARARREEDEAQGVSESDAPLDADKVDIPAADAQTRELFKSSITIATMIGLYLVWASVFPALQGLDRVQLLPTFEVLPAHVEVVGPELVEPVVGAEDAAASTSGSTSTPIPGLRTPPDVSSESSIGLPNTLTLDDLLLAIVFVLLTYIAAKNVPALLELSVLRRLPLDGGARYAVSTIVRYLIVIAGVGSVSGAIGVGWEQVQWLAAALTFGLAFGLQEIFANFVSGLIILFERPIRVGDVVTVAGTEGRVTELRMRRTTIQDYDRRELLVPNKEFITGSIVNWSLSDPINRLVIPVGIAYGSDTATAKKLLLQAAADSELILEDPAPNAVFLNFGESSLDFELRAFIPTREIWAPATHQLHMNIDQLFRQAGIEISFPQRDLHVRTPGFLKGSDGAPSKGE